MSLTHGQNTALPTDEIIKLLNFRHKLNDVQSEKDLQQSCLDFLIGLLDNKIYKEYDDATLKSCFEQVVWSRCKNLDSSVISHHYEETKTTWHNLTSKEYSDLVNLYRLAFFFGNHNEPSYDELRENIQRIKDITPFEPKKNEDDILKQIARVVWGRDKPGADMPSPVDEDETPEEKAEREKLEHDRRDTCINRIVAALEVHDTHYVILGIEPDSDIDDIKEAYKDEVAMVHPDKNPCSCRQSNHTETCQAYKAHICTQALNEARDILEDTQKRASYNVTIKPPQMWDAHPKIQKKSNELLDCYRVYLKCAVGSDLGKQTIKEVKKLNRDIFTINKRQKTAWPYYTYTAPEEEVILLKAFADQGSLDGKYSTLSEKYQWPGDFKSIFTTKQESSAKSETRAYGDAPGIPSAKSKTRTSGNAAGIPSARSPNEQSFGPKKIVPVKFQEPTPGLTANGDTIIAYQEITSHSTWEEKAYISGMTFFTMTPDDVFKVQSGKEVGINEAKAYAKMEMRKHVNTKRNYRGEDSSQVDSVLGVDHRASLWRDQEYERRPATYVLLQLRDKRRNTDQMDVDLPVEDERVIVTQTQLEDWIGEPQARKKLDMFYKINNMPPPWSDAYNPDTTAVKYLHYPFRRPERSATDKIDKMAQAMMTLAQKMDQLSMRLTNG